MDGKFKPNSNTYVYLYHVSFLGVKYSQLMKLWNIETCNIMDVLDDDMYP